MFGQIIKPSHNNKIGEMDSNQLQELKVAFALFDKDADGCITTSELRTVMRTLGFDTSDKEVAQMIQRFDDDGNGTIEFDEFIQMMSSKNKAGVTRWERSCKRDEPESWRAFKGQQPAPDSWIMFKMFDTDRNGYISSTELKAAMKELGVILSDSDVEAMIREADIDGDGKINYQEFVNMMEGKFQSDLKEEEKRLKVEPSPSSSVSASPSRSKTPVSYTKSASPSLTSQKSTKSNSSKLSPRPSRPNGTASSAKRSPTPKSKSKKEERQPMASKVPSSRTSEDITVAEFREVFAMFDANNDGYIQASELGNVMRMLGLPYTPEKLQAMIQNVSTTGNGTVDFQEFLQMMSRSRSKHNSEETRKSVEEDEMRQAFKVFDIDGNGYIDAQELRLTMQNLGENLTEDDVKAMIREADSNGDGKIDYEEFIKMMYKK